MTADGKYRVFDAHCHIYPEKIAEKAVHGTDMFYAGYGDENGSACLGTIGDLLAEDSEAGVDMALVESVATTKRQVRSINEFIAEAVKIGKGKFIGFGTMHPESDDPEGDLRHLKELGLCGVKLHPDIQGFKIDDYRCLKIYELCEKEGLPILMHTGDRRYDNSNPNRLLPILRIYENLTVIGAHFGGWSLWTEAYETLAGTPNLFVDCSSSLPFISSEEAKKIILAYGTDRVLFGTDYPMWKPKKELSSFLSIGLSEEDNHRILYDNAAKLFGIKS